MTQDDQSNDHGLRLLNLGCGYRYHSDWINLDLKSDDPNVICHDVSQGIPFEDDDLDAIYHSHILEHLPPDQGKKLIAECYRVLRPGGVLRVVVPDLEQIARLYLQSHQQAWDGDDSAAANYNWMKLELFDQMVRSTSGGQMGVYMTDPEIENREFVMSRLGAEMSPETSTVPPSPPRKRKSITAKLRRALSRINAKIPHWKYRLATGTVGALLGRSAVDALEEGLFRSQGEIHRWMYDRFSLRALCSDAGFVNFCVCKADQSSIVNYAKFELDTQHGRVRKPDSIFVECIKPESINSMRKAS